MRVLSTLFCAMLLPAASLQGTFESAIAGFDGRVGACGGSECVNGDERFSLQSVIKLVVAMAAMDAVDHGSFRLQDPITIRKQDLSLYVQPIAKLVTDAGYTTTIGDLIRRAVVDSDSAATDILIARLGGPSAVQAFLDRNGVAGVRVDRDERHLQTEIAGLDWKPEYVDAAVLDAALKAVPRERRAAAFKKYQSDPRDTATPRGFAVLLRRFADGELLSSASTRHLWEVMQQTVTFPNRLKAGVPPGWGFGHKTGTGGYWEGVTAVTNDVGIIKTPSGRSVAIVVFIGDSRASEQARASLMAKLARLTCDQYR